MSLIIRRQNGFTLVELMVTVAILGIIAGIAYPSFTSYAQKGRRSEAISKLLELQMAQERYRVKQAAPIYADSMTKLVGAATLTTTYYSYALSGVTATAFTVTATPVSPGAQASDKGCSTIVVTESGPDISTAEKKTCWSK